MRSKEEIRGIADVLAAAVGGGATTVQEVHASIARLPFALLEWIPITRLPASVARMVHDGIAGGVYAGLRGVTRLGAASVALAPLPDVPSAEEAPRSPGWDHAVAALNGIVGDRLEREGNGLRVRMEFRHDGRPLALRADALRRVYPAAGPKLAVFVHGLAGNEHVWRFYSTEHYGDAGTSYGSLLERELDYSPLVLRYNSGLHVSENGRLLAERMEDLVRAWPVPVEEIVLVGHSMGGLVSRSACHQARKRSCVWTERVRHIVCLGTPHLGAPLEKLGNVAGWGLAKLEVTRPFGKLVNRRSAGIKDLRFGYLVEEDWRDQDLDALLEDNRHDIPFLDSATHYFVAATVTRSPRHPLGQLLGDTLVRLPSASGRGATAARRIPFRDEHGRHLGPLTHLRLLNHPAVYAQIRSWLGSPPDPPQRRRPA